VPFCAPAVPNAKPVLERALAADSPVLIEVDVPPGGESSPWGFLHPPPPA
jgi:hypothetical protein